jgi:hypothetical protein
MAAPPFPPIAERHEESLRRYRARDLQGYMSFFAPNLSYLQANGETIHLGQLTAQVATQLRNMGSADWTSRVDSEQQDGDRITETVTQNGTYVATAFGFLHRTWRFERRARYTWKVHEDAWRIAAVEVLEERLTDEGIQFGRK